MPSSLARRPLFKIEIRRGVPGDLDALMALENRVFATDQLSRRSMRRFLACRTAALVVAEQGGSLVGAAVVLYRSGSAAARLYSIAVAPPMSGHGVGATLLEAVEARASAHGCRSMRLEVHETNAGAISRYRKSGYRQFGRLDAYYEDGGAALRFEKPLTRKRNRGSSRG
jgi:ribosomal protein S18 acetylase RimI-like enzyme